MLGAPLASSLEYPTVFQQGSMASSTSDRLHEEVSNITECGICKDVMRCPKILPCVHTFCLKCLEQYGRNKRPNGVMSCPVCREEFQVPSGGISALPANFFIARLLEAQQPSSEREAIEARRRRFMGDISERLREVAGQKLVLGKYTDEYKEKEKQIEEKILQKGQEMKRLIDGQLQSLIMELHSETSVRFIEISNLKEELETRTAGLEVLQMQSEKTLSQAADPSDIARMTNDLKQKATEFRGAAQCGNVETVRCFLRAGRSDKILKRWNQLCRKNYK